MDGIWGFIFAFIFIMLIISWLTGCMDSSKNNFNDGVFNINFDSLNVKPK